MLKRRRETAGAAVAAVGGAADEEDAAVDDAAEKAAEGTVPVDGSSTLHTEETMGSSGLELAATDELELAEADAIADELIIAGGAIAEFDVAASV